MERRIKILNGFTAIVIVLFATMQCNWLYSRYRYTLHEYQDTLYNRVLNVIETGNELRRASVNEYSRCAEYEVIRKQCNTSFRV